MAKSKSPKPSKGKKKNKSKLDIRRALMVGLMLLAALAFIFSSLPPDLFRSNNRTSTTSGTSSSNTANTNTTASSPQFKKEGELTFLKPDGTPIKTIDIEIADNKAERDLGLMYRRSLPEDSGMYFIMDENKEQSFWMKNTYISLDIIYINEDYEIVSIAQGTTPLSQTPIPSNGNAKYVVEVIAGYCAANGIEVGDKLDL